MKRLVTEGATASNVDSPNEVSARDRVREKRITRKRRRTLKAVLITLAICGVTVLVYGLGFWYFSSHYYPGTVVAGVDAAGLTEAELTQRLNAYMDSYEAHVSNGSYELSIPGKDINIACDANKIASSLMLCQDASSWPVGIVGANAREENDLGITFSKDELAKRVTESVEAYNKTARQPVAATLKLDADKKAFSIVAEEEGTALEPAAVSKTVEEAVSQGQSDVALTQGHLVQPAFRESDDATLAAQETANRIITQDVTVAHGTNELATIEPSKFVPWLAVKDDLTLEVNAEEASTYADEWLWQWTDYSDDANAYSIDPAGFAKAFTAFLQAGGTGTLEVPYTTVARYLPGEGKLSTATWNAEVGRYIDVNKKDQVATFYDSQGRVLWETIITTGNEAVGDGTPVGQFAIYDKKTDFVLLGFDNNNDGKPDYENHVDYWMPFNEGIGLHDASWRTEYGGDVYKERGSGGCVNIPRDAVDKLYAIAHVGDVVIVHE